jgi:hypothetical protein
VQASVSNNRAKGRPSCERESCQRRAASDHRWCSMLCRIVDEELSQSQRACQALGPSPATTEHWAAATQLGDLLSRYHRGERALFRAALKQGFTEEQWRTIKRG